MQVSTEVLLVFLCFPGILLGGTTIELASLKKIAFTDPISWDTKTLHVPLFTWKDFASMDHMNQVLICHSVLYVKLLEK